jgi:flavin reductase (DIM6/NTAB) family NADH-FMN oxidoreductase RutF
MNASSAAVPRDVDEFPLAGLTAVRGELVKAPRVKESPAAFECKHWKTIQMPPATPDGPPGYHVVFGLVVGVHIDERFIKDGMVDTPAMRPIARMGYMDYAVVTPETSFSINRPELDESGRGIANATPGAWDGKYR